MTVDRVCKVSSVDCIQGFNCSSMFNFGQINVLSSKRRGKVCWQVFFEFLALLKANVPRIVFVWFPAFQGPQLIFCSPLTRTRTCIRTRTHTRTCTRIRTHMNMHAFGGCSCSCLSMCFFVSLFSFVCVFSVLFVCVLCFVLCLLCLVCCLRLSSCPLSPLRIPKGSLGPLRAPQGSLRIPQGSPRVPQASPRDPWAPFSPGVCPVIVAVVVVAAAVLGLCLCVLCSCVFCLVFPSVYVCSSLVFPVLHFPSSCLSCLFSFLSSFRPTVFEAAAVSGQFRRLPGQSR